MYVKDDIIGPGAMYLPMGKSSVNVFLMKTKMLNVDAEGRVFQKSRTARYLFLYSIVYFTRVKLSA